MSIELQPEVQAFAEAMQRLLDENQSEKGDGWKQDGPQTLVAAVGRKANRLSEAVHFSLYGNGSTDAVRVAAASVAVHAMFVADVLCDLSARAGRASSPSCASESSTGH